MNSSRTILTPDAQIRLTESGGKGLPLVLLHGSGTSRAVFDRQFDSPLAERFRLIALDLPGHGESSDAADPASGYTMPGFARVVMDVLAELDVQRFALFGWSLGGHVAIELMSRHRGLRGTMLMGAPPVAAGPLGMLRGFHANWDMLLASKERFSPRDMARYVELCFGASPPAAALADVARADGRVRVQVSRSMLRGEGADQRRTVEQAPAPVAMVNGENDPLIRLGYLGSLNYTNLWEGRVHLMAGCGHAAFRDQPEVFNALLERFAGDAEAWRAPMRQAEPAAQWPSKSMSL
jgi:pimeloyl-ACP methyl ester carboxylesterase